MRTCGVTTVGLLVLGVVLGACKGDPAPPATPDTTTGDASTGAVGSEAADGSSTGDTEGEAPSTATVLHAWGLQTLAPLEESVPCIQWTLHNEQAIYVNAITLANRGAYHHSNWFAVPEDVFPGPDGFFDCDERGYTELAAAASGTVITAQSTQSRYEEMQLPPGVVVKIPAGYKILAGGHLLNLANVEVETELRMALDIIHPRDVEVVVAPFRLSYVDLLIPASTEARFVGECDLDTIYQTRTGGPLTMKLYWVLPHYHYLGNYFDVTVMGGPDDGLSVHRMEGFDASSNGAVFDPPIDLTGATGLRYTCGYDNWRDEDVGWGIGDQEMCALLGLADAEIMMDATVVGGSQIVGVEDGIQINSGPCGVLSVPKTAAHEPPTAAEIAGELYVPPTDPADQGLEPIDECHDTPADAAPLLPPTLTNLRDTLLSSSCVFSSCHAAGNPAAGLDLTATDLHSVLLGSSTQTGMPRVSPGDPDGSWLYRSISQCQPTDDDGTVRSHMPLNAPTLADPGMVAMVREWIAAGALND